MVGLHQGSLGYTLSFGLHQKSSGVIGYVVFPLGGAVGSGSLVLQYVCAGPLRKCTSGCNQERFVKIAIHYTR